MSTTTAHDVLTPDFIRAAARWPGMQDLADRYGLSPRFVRGLVERQCVEFIHLDKIRVSEESFVDFLRSQYSPRSR